ncbi:hypothetical protein Q5P01_010234 [Channa striata]|uniref:Peptidase S1 domain-containing protein n=1 Tax=Channa striata TaxID=64152 RepID=A0AA88N1S4_CHASR|nr:hypothetical protein Q5P01_010234 [Channa striata]
MEKHETNEPPPPYYAFAVPTQPPQPYGEVGYGVSPHLTPPTQSHYIPQYPPPVAVHQVAPLNISPSAKRKRCCDCNTRCYAGSGGTVTVLALVGLAIWIGVRYGTNLANTVIHYEEEDGHRSENPQLTKYETCPSNAVQCDGIRDCQLGTDETNCVRFGEDNGLQVKTAQDNRFLPVCYQGWDQSIADQTCAQLGFRKSFFSKAVQSQDSAGLTLSHRLPLPIQGLVKVSSSCAGQKSVSLQCVDCGQQQAVSRIIGGSVSKMGQWPWQLSLFFRGLHTCGGILITPDFALTAAHCFPRSNSMALSPENWKVYAAIISLDRLTTAYQLKKILLNENYNNKTNDQDVALLKLTSPVFVSDKVMPVCLPAFDKQFLPGTKCWTTGFGTTVAGSGIVSRNLMEVSVNIIDHQLCSNRLVYGTSITKNMICAGDMEGGKDACQGDSGGPLVCQSDGRWYLVGITSWGAGCGEKNKPGVYTRVTSVLPWIYSNMQLERP